MAVKMIVTDLDRTLLKTDKSISDYTADVLNRCRQNGIRVVFATARPRRTVVHFFESIPADALIADNGAVIYNGEKVAQRIDINLEMSNSFISALLRSKKTSCITVETCESLLSNYSGAHWDKDWNAWNLVYTDFSKEINVYPTKISVKCDDILWLNKLLENYPELHVYTNNGENWSQIMHKDATKWKGILALARHFNIYADDIAAFGDDYNDADMLKNCGVGVAVENALDEVKAAADYICGTNDEDGVALWISRYIL